MEDPRFEEVTENSEPVEKAPLIESQGLPDPSPVPEMDTSATDKGSLFFKKRTRESAPEPDEAVHQPPATPGPEETRHIQPPAQAPQPTIVINPNPVPRPETNFAPKPDIFANEPETVEEAVETSDAKPRRGLFVAGLALALLLSLGSLLISLGVIPGLKIGSQNISPGAVDSSAIYDGAVSEKKLDSQLQEKVSEGGPPGPEGEAGPRGPVGARGPAGITDLQSVSETATGSSVTPVTLVSSCPDGTIALSGGATIRGSASSAMIVESEPVEDFSGWRGGASPTTDGGGSWLLRVWAVCAKPSAALEKNLSN